MLALIALWQFTTQPNEPTVTIVAAAPVSPPEMAPARPVEPPSSTEPVPLAPENISTTPLLDKLLAESRPWLDTVADNRWFVQLFTAIDADSPEQVESFLAIVRNAGLELAQVRVYHLNIEKKHRYGIIFGDYASHKDAVNVLNTLPAELKRYRPYPRQAVRLKLDGNTTNKN
jgi:septal ring-binding cell division protein DamX